MALATDGAEGFYNVQIMDEQQTINAKDLPTCLRDVDRYIARREKILAQIFEGGI